MFNQPMRFNTTSVESMIAMFYVRPARVHAMRPRYPVGPLPCKPLVPPRHPTPLPYPCPHLAPGSYALLTTRQQASAFNQPLSLDTSKVTAINHMFNVRPRTRATHMHLIPSVSLASPSPHTGLLLPGLLAVYSSSAVYALLSTWQEAAAFNQPLSFDTSSVTHIQNMFAVRSPRVPSAQSQVGPHVACAAVLPPPSPARPATTPPGFACPLVDSAGSVGVQPATKSRHV